MFDILSKDAFRKQIECASDNEVTVLYDDMGFPSLMHILPKMTIGDCFPAGVAGGVLDPYLTDTHPAFQIYDESGNYVKDVSEIFVGQYRSTPFYGNPDDYDTYRYVSLPGYESEMDRYYASDEYFIRNRIESKGSNWHLMNIWEYSAIQFQAYKNNIQIEGQKIDGVDSKNRTSLFGTQVIFLAVSNPNWITNEQVYCNGKYGRLVAFENAFVLLIQDIYGGFFQNGEEIFGLTSGTSSTIGYVMSLKLSGSGPLDYSHNHKYSGIWDLASYGNEVVDGCIIHRQTYDGDDNYHMIKLSPGNYYHWNDSLLQAYPVKLASVSGGLDPTLVLGYQEIDGAGVPTGSLLDYNISKTVTGYSEEFSTTTNYDNLVTSDQKKMFLLSGLQPVEFTDSQKVSKREYIKINRSVPAREISILSKARAFSNTENYSSMWNNLFSAQHTTLIGLLFSTFYSRVVYIP